MMAHSLGLEVIAEGIEDQPQLSFLREHNCELGQGFGLGKPVHAEQFSDLIEKSTPKTTVGNGVVQSDAMLKL